MDPPPPLNTLPRMKKSSSAVSSIRSLSSRDGQLSIDSVSSPSLKAQPSPSFQQDNGPPPNPSRIRDNFKITIMGDKGVGKSEMVKKYAYGHTHFRFSPGDRISGSKLVKLSNNDDYMLSINDTFSLHMDTPIAAHQIGHADGVMLVFTPTSANSLDTVVNVFNFIASHFKDPKGRKTLPVVIVANQADRDLTLQERQVLQQGIQFASERSVQFYETSALTEQGIDDAFRGMAERIVTLRSEKKKSDDMFTKLKRRFQGK